MCCIDGLYFVHIIYFSCFVSFYMSMYLNYFLYVLAIQRSIRSRPVLWPGPGLNPQKLRAAQGGSGRAPPSPGLFPALTPLALTVAPCTFTWVQTPSPQSTRRMTEDSLLPVSTRQSWSLKCESSGNCFRWFVTSQGHTVTTRMHIVH